MSVKSAYTGRHNVRINNDFVRICGIDINTIELFLSDKTKTRNLH